MRPSLDPVALRRVVERQESSRVVLDLIISGPRRSGSKFGTSHAAAAECSLASLLDLGRRHTPPDLTVPGSSGGFAALRSPSFLCIAPLSLVHERPWCVSDLQLRDPARETARDVDTRRSRARRWSRSLPEILLLWTPGDSGLCSQSAVELPRHSTRTPSALGLRFCSSFGIDHIELLSLLRLCLRLLFRALRILERRRLVEEAVGRAFKPPASAWDRISGRRLPPAGPRSSVLHAAPCSILLYHSGSGR